ncbi:MAG: hypothetical protein MRY64_00635 [Hyphomonadaceae bacterium]|nr:hypothetical protein [Hyphomonadaceae bacterium]
MTPPTTPPKPRWAIGFLTALGPGLWLAVSVFLIWDAVSMISGGMGSEFIRFCEAQVYLSVLRDGPFILAYFFLLPWLGIFALAAGALLFTRRVAFKSVVMVLMASVLAWGLPLLLSVTPLGGAYDRALVRCIDDQREQQADLSDIVADMVEDTSPTPPAATPPQPEQPTWEELEPWIRAWAYKTELTRFCDGEVAEEEGFIATPDAWAGEIAAMNAEVAAEFEDAEAEYVCTPEMFEETDQRVEEAAMALGRAQNDTE